MAYDLVFIAVRIIRTSFKITLHQTGVIVLVYIHVADIVVIFLIIEIICTCFTASVHFPYTFIMIIILPVLMILQPARLISFPR